MGELPSEKELKEVFMQYAGDNESIDKDEFKLMCYIFYIDPTSGDLDQEFKKLDKNADETLTFHEVKNYIEANWKSISDRQEQFRQDLQKIRKKNNKEGLINRVELRDILQQEGDDALTDEDLDAVYKLIDLDDDGEVSEEELIYALFGNVSVSRAISRQSRRRSRSRSSSKDRKRSRSGSKDRKRSRSGSKDRKRSRSGSKDRKRSRSSEKHRSGSRDRKRSRSRDSKRSGSSKSHGSAGSHRRGSGHRSSNGIRQEADSGEAGNTELEQNEQTVEQPGNTEQDVNEQNVEQVTEQKEEQKDENTEQNAESNQQIDDAQQESSEKKTENAEDTAEQKED